jgi:hypothetical protein
MLIVPTINSRIAANTARPVPLTCCSFHFAPARHYGPAG